MAQRRITELSEATVLKNDMFVPVDHSADGTKKVSLDTMLSNKANIDGLYEEMTVGNALQLVSDVMTEDNAAYNFRPAGGSNAVGDRAYMKKVVGGSLVWNQSVVNGNFANTNDWTAIYGSISANDNECIYTISTLDGSYANRIQQGNITTLKGHKYLAVASIYPLHANAVRFRINTNIQNFETLTANKWNVLSTIFNPASDETGYIQIGQLTNTGYSVGDTIKYRNIYVIDLTSLLIPTIADYIYTLEQTTPGLGVAWVRRYITEDYIPYSEPHFEHTQTDKMVTVGFNLFDKANYSKIDGGYFLLNGEIALASNRELVYIPCLPNTSYCASRDAVMTNERFYIGYTNEVPATGVSVYGSSAAPTSQTVGDRMTLNTTTGANAKYLVIWLYWSNHPETVNTLNINFVKDGSRDGDYEPYQKREYALDPVVLRGIPKLDDSNNLCFDGDEYGYDVNEFMPECKVTRRVSEPLKMLSTFNWQQFSLGSGSWQYYLPNTSNTPNINVTEAGRGGISNLFKSIDISERLYSGNDNSLYFGSAGICFRCDSIATLDAWKTFLDNNDVYVEYNLATPTTESAEPYQYPMVIDSFGTEEFIDYAKSQGNRAFSIPVGHVTDYPQDLKSKVESLPNLASANGNYIISQVGNQMYLVPMTNIIPAAPTTDGSYKFGATVASGQPTYGWVEDE